MNAASEQDRIAAAKVLLGHTCVTEAMQRAEKAERELEEAKAELATMRTDFAVGDQVCLLNHIVTVTSLLDGRQDVEVELGRGGRREHVARTMLLKKPA